MAQAGANHFIQIDEDQPYLTSLTFFNGNERRNYFNFCLPLYKAAVNGNWRVAERLIAQQNNLVRVGITHNRDTALHIASSTKHTRFVENLVDRMRAEDLKLKNQNKNTALCIAAIGGNVKIAAAMVRKCSILPKIRGRDNMFPVYMAALFGRSEMVAYLYSRTNDLTDDDKIALFYACVDNEIFVLMRVGPVEKRRQAIEITQIIWKRVLKLEVESVWDIIRGPAQPDDTHPYRLLNVATELGNTTFLIELIRLCPELMWKRDDNKRNIFQVATLHRQESVYRLLHEIGSMKELLTLYVDHEDNTILHLAALRPAQERLNVVPGVAFQMQSELRWFKEVDSIVNPSIREMKNSEGKTAQALFTEKHATLVSEAEKWMTSTSTQCMVVAALITTVTFTGGFTVPGGDLTDKGFPVFLHRKLFTVFAIADAISLAMSSGSILFFLSIITSRFAEDDFLVILPLKLMLGLLALFISILSMMAAFSVSFFLAYRNDHKKVAISIAIIAAIPIIIYALLQLPLSVAVIRSTIGSRYLFNRKKRTLFL